MSWQGCDWEQRQIDRIKQEAAEQWLRTGGRDPVPEPISPEDVIGGLIVVAIVVGLILYFKVF